MLFFIGDARQEGPTRHPTQPPTPHQWGLSLYGQCHCTRDQTDWIDAHRYNTKDACCNVKCRWGRDERQQAANHNHCTGYNGFAHLEYENELNLAYDIDLNPPNPKPQQNSM